MHSTMLRNEANGERERKKWHGGSSNHNHLCLGSGFRCIWCNLITCVSVMRLANRLLLLSSSWLRGTFSAFAVRVRHFSTQFLLSFVTMRKIPNLLPYFAIAFPRGQTQAATRATHSFQNYPHRSGSCILQNCNRIVYGDSVVGNILFVQCDTCVYEYATCIFISGATVSQSNRIFT